MSKIMESEADDPRAFAQLVPSIGRATSGYGIASAFDAAGGGAIGNESEHEIGMVTLQRPKNFADGRGDRHRDQSATLAELADLASREIDFCPFQQAFV